MKRQSFLRRHARGVAIIEAMIAATVLAVGLLASAAFHTRIIQTSSESRAASEALYFAQSTVDALHDYAQIYQNQRVVSLDQVPFFAPGSHPVAEQEPPPFPTQFQGTSGVFDVTWFVADTATVGDDFFRSVAVTATLNEDPTVSATLHTFLATSRFDALIADEGPVQVGRAVPREGKYADEDGFFDPDHDDLVWDPSDPSIPAGETGLGVRVNIYDRDASGAPCLEIIDECTGDALELQCGAGYARISGNLVFNGAQADPFDSNLFNLPGGVEHPRTCRDLNRLVRSADNAGDVGICSVLPFEKPFNDPNDFWNKRDDFTLIPTDNGNGFHRVLAYSCFVAEEWYGPIRLSPFAVPMQGTDPQPLSVCIGSPDGDPARVDVVRLSSGELRFNRSRHYIGFDPNLTDYVGIKGSPVYGDASFGSPCLGGAIDGGAEKCVLDGIYPGAEILVPGGHHFLVTSLDANLDLEGQRAACAAEMADVGKGAFVGKLFDQANPRRLTCLTPDTCGYYPRLSGHLANEAGNVIPADVIVKWARSTRTGGLEGECQVFGAFGANAGTYWCMAPESLVGRVYGVPGASGPWYEPMAYFYSTRVSDPENPGFFVARDPKLFGTASAQVRGAEGTVEAAPRRLDFVHLDIALNNENGETGDENGDTDAGGDDEIVDEVIAVAPSVTWGSGNVLTWNAVQHADSYEVYSCQNTGTNALNPCTVSLESNPAVTSGLSYTTGTDNRTTYCYRVAGSNDSFVGPASGTFCTHRQGQTFTRTSE